MAIHDHALLAAQADRKVTLVETAFPQLPTASRPRTHRVFAPSVHPVVLMLAVTPSFGELNEPSEALIAVPEPAAAALAPRDHSEAATLLLPVVASETLAVSVRVVPCATGLGVAVTPDTIGPVESGFAPVVKVHGFGTGPDASAFPARSCAAVTVNVYAVP